MGYRSSIFSLVLIGLFLVIPLTLWVVFFKWSDLAALTLLVPFTLIFWSDFSISAPSSRARYRVSIKRSSGLRDVLTGRLKAVILGFIFSVLTALLLAMNSVSLSKPEVYTYLTLTLCGALLSWIIDSWVTHHFIRPYSVSYAATLSTFILSLLFVPIVAWANWNFVFYPGELRDASLGDAIKIATESLPRRRTLMVEIMAVFNSFEMIKLWLVLKVDAHIWARLAFSFDTAIAAILLARAISVISIYTRSRPTAEL